MRRRLAGLLLALGLTGCAVDVATLNVAAPRVPAAEGLQTATSLGVRDGWSCRLWILGVPFGLPQVDEAIADALAPVGGVYIRDATIWSVHPTYGVYGWHCYHAHGEAYGPP